MEKNLTKAVTWGKRKQWEKEDPKHGRLEYLTAILLDQGTYSKSPAEGPDDISPFGDPVYLKDMNAIQLKEYILSGMSTKEQNRIFSS